VIAFLRDYAPSPATRPTYTAGGDPVAADVSAPLHAVVFNVKSDPHVGKVCLARIVQGTLRASDVIGSGRGEKLGGLFHAVGGRRRDNAESISAGDIAAFSKVEALRWGQSFGLTDQNVKAIDLPELPPPMVSLAITPKSRNDEQKIGQALQKLETEDPGFRIEHAQLTHELIMHGMSDLHLQVMESRLKRRFGVEINTALPRIAYRETVTKPAEGHHRHKKQSGGRGQFGECYVRVRPGAEGSGVNVLDKVVGGSIPRNLIPAVEKGVREISETGILTHSKVVDVEIQLYDGKFHAVDSDEASFKKAGANAFRDGFGKAGPVLLEPIMTVEIHVPSEDAGIVFSDLTSQRRGHVIDQSSEDDGAVTIIRAHVPLATVLTYHRDLKSQTAGEGSFTMKLENYARVPANEQARIIAEFGKRHEEE
jgi:elongation factor G